MAMTRQERIDLASRRLIRVLSSHHLATARTLEQKISDAGPSPLRVDPHLLTEARNALQEANVIRCLPRPNAHWYYLSDTPYSVVEQRLAELEPIHQAIQAPDFLMRMGQSLEIAVFRALRQQPLLFFGHFPNLDQHADDQLYSKEEPPTSVSGLSVPSGKRLDFLLVHPSAGLAGIEVKNIREWLYPNRAEPLDLLFKCCHLNAVPILIARRIPFVTFRLLQPCGLIIHQTYRQRYPSADCELAAKARHKRLLGYHDLALGNDPDERLLRFLRVNLPAILPTARTRFERSRELLADYANARINYAQFASEVARRFAVQLE